jgi:hypothetical protein
MALQVAMFFAACMQAGSLLQLSWHSFWILAVLQAFTQALH